MENKLTKTAIKKRAMIKALEKSLGIVTSACQDVGIARETHYEWLRIDPEYKRLVDGIEDVAIDFAESSLYNNIKNKDVASTIFFLKTKGRRRGYAEHQQIDLNNNITSKSTPEEAARFFKELLNECEEK